MDHYCSFFRGRELSTRHEEEAALAFLRLDTARFGRAIRVVHVARLRHGEWSSATAPRNAGWKVFAVSFV